MKLNLLIFATFISMSILFLACSQDTQVVNEEPLEWDKTPYFINTGNFPPPMLPEDNKPTVQGVQLGRMLFYEKKLSRTNSQACGDCHIQAFAFTDTAKFSIGVRGELGKRSSMSVFNMAWNRNRFFWDGRAELLRHQSLMPIQDELEMDETLENVVSKLSAEKMYRDQFYRAFGTSEINSTLISYALEQFMMSIVSNNSKYDQVLTGMDSLNESEERGRKLFFSEFNPFFPEESGADCAHCHGDFNLANNRYFNNGLDNEAEIKDIGLQAVTNNPNDKGKFKTVSLRNIAITAPYMHDSRFSSLEEVVNHYDSGLKPSRTLDPALEYTRTSGLGLSQQQKADLINFMKTFTDYDLTKNPAYSNPFAN